MRHTERGENETDRQTERESGRMRQINRERERENETDRQREREIGRMRKIDRRREEMRQIDSERERENKTQKENERDRTCACTREKMSCVNVCVCV
jgi:hypothetical protein